MLYQGTPLQKLGGGLWFHVMVKCGHVLRLPLSIVLWLAFDFQVELSLQRPREQCQLVSYHNIFYDKQNIILESKWIITY